ncbi:MAG: HAD family hydrolase [Dehalococcoidia bacterium]
MAEGVLSAKAERAAGDKRIRLVAVDLDGTLLEHGNRVSEGNAAAVRDAVAAGVHVVLATARWYLLAKRTAGALGIVSPIICHNGAMVRDPRDDAKLLDLPVPAEPSVEIAAIADDARYESMATVADVTYMITRRPDIELAKLPGGMVLTERLSDHVRDGADGFLFFGQDAVDGVRSRLAGRYHGELNLAWGVSATFPPYLNIVHAAADKGRALQLVCEHTGVPPEQALAIGDARPDLEMMRVAGLSIAMGNAPDDVKAEADAAGPDNRQDGVAWALRTFVI